MTDDDRRAILARKQRERRARRLAEGTPRPVVWGHTQRASGTGWDTYNARRAYAESRPEGVPPREPPPWQ